MTKTVPILSYCKTTKYSALSKPSSIFDFDLGFLLSFSALYQQKFLLGKYFIKHSIIHLPLILIVLFSFLFLWGLRRNGVGLKSVFTLLLTKKWGTFTNS